MTHRCATCGRYSRDRKQEALRERVHEDLRAYVEPSWWKWAVIGLGIFIGTAFGTGVGAIIAALT